MLQYTVLSLLLGFGFIDLFFFHSHSYTLVLLYGFLRIHSEMAAERFLRSTHSSAHSTVTKEAEDYFAQIKLPKNIEVPHRQDAKKAVPPIQQAKKPTKLFEAPNFKGQAHEILGIEINAETKIIQLAFRHWIKKYHPDHQSSGLQGKATNQARCLQEAKLEMLEKRAKYRLKTAA